MTTPYIDPNLIFAKNAPVQDKPAAFSNYDKGWDESRTNDGRPLIPQMNYLTQQADLKNLYIHENGAALPYKEGIAYEENAVVVKDGVLQQWKGGEWVIVGAKTDADINTWSGRTQEDKNKENPSPLDYGAKGDATTNDTQAFIELEAEYQGKIIDLLGKTYKTKKWFVGNTYVNGFFEIDGNTYRSNLDVFSISRKKHAMDFYTGDSGISTAPEIFPGSKNTFQAFCIVPMDDGLHLFVCQSSYGDGTYTSYGNFLKGETYRIVEYMFKEDGSLQQPIAFSLPLNTLGHASNLGYKFHDGELYLYSGAPNESETDVTLGGKGFTRIKWRGNSTSNADVQVFTMFDPPSNRNGIYPDLCKCAVSVATDGTDRIILRGNNLDSELFVIYDLNEVLAAANPKTVKPLIDFVIPNESRTFQGLHLHGNYVFTLWNDKFYCGSVVIYDLAGHTVRDIPYIELVKYLHSYNKYRGGDRTILNLFELEGIFVHGNSVYIGHREYWQRIDTVVSYGGKLYTPNAASIPVGTLPTDYRYFQEVDAVPNVVPTAWDAGVSYTTGAERKEIYKRITRLNDVVGDAFGASNQPTVVPTLENRTSINVPFPNNISINYWDDATQYRNLFYYNPLGELRLFNPRGAGVGCALRISTIETDTSRYCRLRGDESYGGTIQLRSKDDTTEYKGGIIEFVGLSGNTQSRFTNYLGENYFSASAGSVPVNSTTTSANEDMYRGYRGTSLKYAVLANASFTWVGSRGGNSLRFSTSENDNLGTANAVELALSGGGWRPLNDNSIPLGAASNRWSTVYAATGSINTSDERLKQQFRSQTQREKDAALEIKNSICLFKFNDAVDLKGDGARWHVGVKAQQVIAILESHDLDPFDYAFVCFDEWDATDEHEAGSRYAIRYDELAMFILSAI